eukprot:CAMPEP_0113711424 /NCGR_PEP_ID=MMETSP0038_2-20120614/30746_1 /TAXON_ID=2898 /ORGANISM="Cryptomonas paramecium" /LENGTH=118 /DNA_ID=CAMNT_0000637673 /DNA_START=40 /DNA_END=392 /DNA_ORIENTATION=+ /assembly_acc=CAM_ASM_000170
MTLDDYKAKFDWDGSKERRKKGYDRKIGGDKSYLEKKLADWDFEDVLHFFQTSVTNDRRVIDTIRLREVDGQLLDSFTNDEEMSAALNMHLIHVRKFRIKIRQVQELFNAEMDEEEKR